MPRMLLLAIIAGCARNPQVAPTSVPVSLVNALIDDRESATHASPKYSVGQLPPGYPTALVPTGPVTIVGGMTTSEEIVAVFSDSTRRLAAIMEQLFEQHGFTRPQATPGSGFSQASGPYSFFCGDSGTIFVAPLAGANRSFARVSYRRASGRSFCRTSEPVRSAGELKLPELKPPPAVFVKGTHGGSGSEGVHSEAEMTGANLSAATIVAHYAAQLISAGWTSEPPAVSSRVAAQFFNATDAAGGAWEGVLMASGSETELRVSLTMRRRTSR